MKDNPHTSTVSLKFYKILFNYLKTPTLFILIWIKCGLCMLIGSDGAAVKELLTTVMTNTPHMWSQHTLQCFPPVLVEFFAQV